MMGETDQSIDIDRVNTVYLVVLCIKMYIAQLVDRQVPYSHRLLASLSFSFSFSGFHPNSASELVNLLAIDSLCSSLLSH